MVKSSKYKIQIHGSTGDVECINGEIAWILINNTQIKILHDNACE